MGNQVSPLQNNVSLQTESLQASASFATQQLAAAKQQLIEALSLFILHADGIAGFCDRSSGGANSALLASLSQAYTKFTSRWKLSSTT